MSKQKKASAVSAFGSLICEARKNKDLSQAQLSELLIKAGLKRRPSSTRIHQSLVGHWENDNGRVPRLESLPLFEKILDIPLPDLWRAYKQTIAEQAGLCLKDLEP